MLKHGGVRSLERCLLRYQSSRVVYLSCSQRRAISSDAKDWLDLYKNTLQRPAATHQIGKLSTENVGEKVVLHGYLGPGRRRDMSKKLSFWNISSSEESKHVQIVLFNASKTDDVQRSQWLHLPPQSPVAIEGTVKTKKLSKNANVNPDLQAHEKIEIDLENVAPLNLFPPDLEATDSTNLTAEQRHLEIRRGSSLTNALKFRAQAASVCRNILEKREFLEIETPMLFKSTPEGAREFLVPTRTKGMAYALPQSPQQYKQILMASGIAKYYQFARCFRDEDLRADRQPEFTQLDLEMSFADEHTVMSVIEDIIRGLWQNLLKYELPAQIPHMTYEEAMARYGSDKPDTRFGMEIISCDQSFSEDDIRSRFGIDTSSTFEYISLPQPLNEEFVGDFLASIDAAEFVTTGGGKPQMASEKGALILWQKRKKQAFSGGSTNLGRLRLALHKHAVAKGLMPKSEGFHFLWVKDFPLFSPTNDQDPGQGGFAGLSSTHHPFTAPLTAEDVDLLATNPERARAAHYDLVVNGVELGGGSRRIHVAAVQEYVLRNVLRMPEKRIEDFRHLLTVLSHGCPPHAGIALGFDRLIAVMLGLDSVRDVIAFPKSGSGEDMLVKSPNRLTEEQLATYHLTVK